VTRTKPLCSLSLDLDNKWSYMKTHGDSGWESLPSYLDVVVPRFIQVLDGFGWRITVFIVGQDAALDANGEALAAIGPAGHEIGNHSFHHEPWLHLYSRDQTEDEITRAEEAIEAATGITPRGFRGPGYSLSTLTLEVLAKRGYRYDASTFPTYLGPLARAYYFLSSDFSKEEKAKRKVLFGSLKDGTRPVRPYYWKLEGQQLLEVPVTTMPVLKLPFHFSYLIYLASFSRGLALLYFRAALSLCRVTGTEPSLLLHPLDFVGGDDVPGLEFFPGMRLTGAEKLGLLNRFLGLLSSRYTVLPLGNHADAIRESRSLKIRTPA
jgi:hypothetical protein